MVRVVVVDDQSMVRAGLAALLGAAEDLVVVGDAADGEQAVATCRELRPDVVLMDVRMPVKDGLQAAGELLSAAELYPRPRVLMLTTFDVDTYVYEALRIGASGFLLKDAPPEDLVSAVRVVARGDGLLAPSVTRRLIERFSRAPDPVRPWAHRVEELTARERDVLRLIARGLSNGEIAEHLVVAEETVKTHTGRIFGKLELRDRAQAVVFAYESGIVTAGGDLPTP